MNSFHVLPPRPTDDPRDHVLVVCVKRLGMVSSGEKYEMRTTSIELHKAVYESDAKVRSMAPKNMDETICAVYWYTFFELQSYLIINNIYPWGPDHP